MRKKTSQPPDALDLVYREFYEGKPDRIAGLEQARAEGAIARKIYDLRTSAELSQGALAKLAGTTAAVIGQLEDADYDGNYLAMLNRIAGVLNKRVEIRCVSLRAKVASKSVPA